VFLTGIEACDPIIYRYKAVRGMEFDWEVIPWYMAGKVDEVRCGLFGEPARITKENHFSRHPNVDDALA